VLGYNVLKLHRAADGPITADGLARGEWRHLTKREIAALKRNVGLS
jgi:16S rRNA U516 pseudouridylate synthase RsuA-like enzyme